MTSIGAFEAKSQFSALLERAAAGEEITITKHGRPVARLVPVAAADREVARKAFEQMRELRKGMTTGGLDLVALRDEGRR